jgi:hypothetical protein
VGDPPDTAGCGPGDGDAHPPRRSPWCVWPAGLMRSVKPLATGTAVDEWTEKHAITCISVHS